MQLMRTLHCAQSTLLAASSHLSTSIWTVSLSEESRRMMIWRKRNTIRCAGTSSMESIPEFSSHIVEVIGLLLLAFQDSNLSPFHQLTKFNRMCKNKSPKSSSTNRSISVPTQTAMPNLWDFRNHVNFTISNSGNSLTVRRSCSTTTALGAN